MTWKEKIKNTWFQNSAPEEYLLDQTYLNSDAFSFFDTCRGNFKCPDEEEMIKWAEKLEESTQKEGFCLFLLSNSVAAEAICELYREEDETLRAIGWLHPLELKIFSALRRRAQRA